MEPTMYKSILAIHAIPALLLLSSVGYAQHKNTPGASPGHPKTEVIAKSYEDSIVIRWAPRDPAAWITGNLNGYHLTRIDISEKSNPVKTVIGRQQILPMTAQQLMTGIDTGTTNGHYRMLATRILYGGLTSTSHTPTANFVEGVRNQHGALNLRYMVAMATADQYPQAADMFGLRWVDRDVKKGARYIYIISSPSPGVQTAVDSAAVLVLNIKALNDAAPAGLEAFGYDHAIEIRWNRNQSGKFSGYQLERSDNGGSAYHALTDAPYNSSYIPSTGDKKKDSMLTKINHVLKDYQVYNDSVGQDYKTYYYRLRALNPFGEWTIYSKPVAIQARDLTPPIPPIADSAKNIRDNLIKIWWTARRQSPDLAGYYVDRGDSAKGPFYSLSKNMLGRNERSFIDSSALPHKGNFYVVIAVDTAGNASVSSPVLAFLTDSIAPAAPVGLTGKIDSNGLVRLRWDRNKEPDMDGYQLFSSYDSTYHFIAVSHTLISDTVYTDTISMESLNRQIYYKVLAVDKNFNHSDPSPMATLKKPVIIPPTPPAPGTVKVDGNLVDIEWIQSRNEGAAAYQVYRKETAGSWIPLSRLTADRLAKSLHFFDTTTKSNTDYLYCAETIDVTGIRSERSFPVHLRRSTKSALPAPDNFQAVYDGDHHSVSLSWKYSGQGDYYFVVYRSFNGGTLTAWKSYEKSELSGKDRNIQGGAYRYAIKIVHKDKRLESALTSSAELQIK